MPIDIELVIKLKLPMMKIVGLSLELMKSLLNSLSAIPKFYVVRITNLQLVLRNFYQGLFLQQRKLAQNVCVGQQGEYLEFVHGTSMDKAKEINNT
ncbi:17618_t:CDS:2 [Funneliformis caledonium]|uniref:17618_t:CDS:1 n=1 Tax=Funneliformis caledonium TaxID=1117310 RepID=A0A9N9ARI7_9GLOM|nr:17618_t:CDS:2 [Funneliformis caledonium]